MTSKNNQVERLTKSMPLTQRFALRKLSVGVASVLLGTSIMMGLNGKVASADSNTDINQSVPTQQLPVPTSAASQSAASTITTLTATNNNADEQVKATAPVDPSAYTITNVSASSEPGNGTDRIGRTNLSFDMNIDVAHHTINKGDYLNVSMGIPYKLTADDQEHTLAYGGSASEPMAININYNTVTGENHSAVIGYMRPVSTNTRAYAVSGHENPVDNVENVKWQSMQNKNTLTSDGNGGSNDSYQIVFNDELENIKQQYGDANLSLARMHFNLTWHNITGFNLDEAPIDTRYFHLYSANATTPVDYTPQNDILIGNQRFTSGLKVKVMPKADYQDNFNQTVIPESSSQYATHTWYYDQNTGKWGKGDEALRYPDHAEAVALASKTKDGTQLGNKFTITVTKPADNEYVDYQFASDADVKADLEKSMVANYRNYDLDPVNGVKDTYVTRELVTTPVPDINVTSTDSNNGLTRTYTVTVANNYAGFRKDKGIALINWRPKNPTDVLPPENINSPVEDKMINDGWYEGVMLQNSALQNFLAQHSWSLKVTNDNGQDLYNANAGYYLQPYTYRDDTVSNSGILNGTVNNVENSEVKETIHYLFKDTGKEAAPTYTKKLGFARINQNGTWQDWTPASDTFEQVTVPVVPGYHAVDNAGTAVKAVAAVEVDHNSSDIDTTIYYVADPQLLTYTVIDNDTNQILEDKVPLVKGNSNEKIPAQTATAYQQIIKGYLDQGYYLVKADQLPATFDSDDDFDQNVTIYVAKKNQLKKESRQVTRTITYYDRDTGKQIAIKGVDPVKQTVTFARNAVTSGVDGKVLGYNLDGKQDQNGNYLLELSTANGDRAWQQTAGKWGSAVNPLLIKYGYGLAEDTQGQAYPQVAVGQPTYDSSDEEVKVFYPEKVVVSPENSTIIRTIKYVYGNGPQKGKEAAPSVKQTVTFKRDKRTNQVTNDVSYSEWTTSNDSFAAVKSPAIEYYTPSQTQVAAVKVDPADQDSTVTVIYKTAPNAVTYTVIDDTTDKTLIDHQSLVDGFAGEQVPASASDDYQAVVKHYQNLGYTIVSQDKLPGLFTHQDQNVIIHLLMKNALRTDQQLTTRTITYYDRDTGKQIMIDGITDPVIQQAKFVRHGVVVGPEQKLVGYNLDGKRDHNGNYLVEVAVKNADQAWIMAGNGWVASPNPDLDYYGYGPAENEAGKAYPVVGAVEPTAATPNESVKVYYRARHETGTEQSTAERIIHYIYANGPRHGQRAAGDVRQRVTFERPVMTNEVTKQKTYGDWQAVSSITANDNQTIKNDVNSQFAAVTSPSISDYTADQLVVNSIAAVHNQKPIEVTVNYTTEPHRLTYSVIDDVTGLTLINHYYLAEGFTDEQLSVKTGHEYNSVPAHYEQLGYELVSQDTLPTAFASHDQDLVIHLTHGIKQVTDEHAVNEEVKYQFVDGGTAAPTYEAAPIKFTRNGEIDQVTGKTEWQNWQPAGAEFKAVVSPSVAGYRPSVAQIDEQLVNEGSADLHFIVMYSKNSVVPHSTPEEPTQPVTPATPQPTVPTSSSSATSNTPAEPSQVPSSETPASSASVPESSARPSSDGPADSNQLAEPASSAVPVFSASVSNSSEESASSVPAASTANVQEEPVVAHPASEEKIVPVTVHAATAEPVENSAAQPAQQTNQKLPQTGNQHRSLWQVIVGAFLGLFGIVLGRKRKVK
ncbi:YSIRK-type signal peptide-containing protein [Limosilactobacillus sp. STM2_1]|uniref:YSIRK-type signal peptide-containing protein n=1 Tax=Limosilactobacillus rudii TaxID=2759755 RepID=A0A7W3UJP3_9LACO|nr:YSIRK-type signal peptide-containing protein [Limosilactobacillus rudii]MBB1080275.1 YSIRK-type signal peptide-containing protein [Limosilactobacillus rudii]MBB1096821.1 YSIRK-type signal peptide-containing protein [Limosilactobacillus rudii]MCD7133718.1 YSIRK-type signal peptide-containing protein [Limosilactobacillus rudii]